MRFEFSYDYKCFTTHTLLNHMNLMYYFLIVNILFLLFVNYVTNSLLLCCLCVWFQMFKCFVFMQNPCKYFNKLHKEICPKEWRVYMVYIFNPSTWETEAGWFLWVHGHAGLHNKFQASQGYIIRPCLKRIFLKLKENPHFKVIITWISFCKLTG